MSRGPEASPGCASCPFAKGGKPWRPVAGEGPSDPEWIIVGEGPGDVERAVGSPFRGPSGRLLNRTLGGIGADRERLWVTNVLLCTPPGATDVQKRKASECCWPRLREELGRFPGRPVLALGALAAESLLGDEFSITELAGSYHEVDVDGTGPRGILPTVHPAYIIRGGAGAKEGEAHTPDLLVWNLLWDARKVHALAKGESVRFGLDVDVEVSDKTRAERLFLELVDEIRRERIFALDTETTSLRPLEARVTAVALATTKRGLSLAMDVCTDRVLDELRKLLADPGLTVVFHNSLYDVPVLIANGFDVRAEVHDTLLLHHNVFPGADHKLQRVATQFFVIPPWKAEFRAGEGSIEELCRYNAIDALATARLFPALRSLVAQKRTERSYEADRLKARMAVRCYLAGLPIDEEENRRLEDEFNRRLAEVERRLDIYSWPEELRENWLDRLAMEQAKRVRKSDSTVYLDRYKVRLAELRKQLEKRKLAFKPNSGEHVAAICRAREVYPSAETRTGKTSTKREVLERLRRVEEVDAVLEGRECQKMLSTFVLKVRNAMRDGRIHPRPKVHLITGRWAFEDPMIQNWSKGHRRRHRPNIRRQVVAPPGRVIVAFDFDKQEARGIALVSGDPYLLDIFEKGKDIHLEMAKLVWPDIESMDPAVRKELRDFIKRPEYGACYAGSVDVLWRNILKDDPEVRREDIELVVTTLQKKLVGVRAWWEETMREVARPPHELRSVVFGRRRCWPTGEVVPTEAINWRIQTLGSELMDLGMAKIEHRLPKGVYILTQVHDALVFECDEGDQAKELEALLYECFESTIEYKGRSMHFPIEVKTGRSWADV